MKKIILITLLIIFAFVALVAVFGFAESALAQDTTTSRDNLGYTPLEALPGVSDWDGTLSGYLNRMFSLFIGICAVLAVLMIVISGFQYMTSGDSESARKEAKSRITGALLGLLIALSSVLILQTINPDLLDFDLKLKNIPGGRGGSTGGLPPSTDPIPTTPPDGKLSFQTGIRAQLAHASDPLNQLLGCMAKELPGNMGNVSSISDSYIINGNANFEECASGKIGCAHTKNSCHYGGKTCLGESYAVDFGDEGNYREILIAAQKCSSPRLPTVINEGDHIHVSIGNAYGCGCN